MAGKPDMTLHGLRQLAEWSIEHSCMEPQLRAEVCASWEGMWDAFCQRIVNGEFTLQDDTDDDNAEGNVAGPADRPAGGLPPV